MENILFNEFNRKNWFKTLQRIEVIEEKVFKKTKRIASTKAQRVLLLKELGLLEKVDELNLSQNHKALLLSVLLDADPENVEKDLAQIHKKDSRLQTEQNFQFLVTLFEKVGLGKHEKQAEKMLVKIRQKIK